MHFLRFELATEAPLQKMENKTVPQHDTSPPEEGAWRRSEESPQQSDYSSPLTAQEASLAKV